MTKLLLFNKPYGVLSNFTDAGGRPNLSSFIAIPKVYPAGRLDSTSEGLLLLTDNGQLQHRIAHPDHKLVKTYFVQVEGTIKDPELKRLRKGVELNDGLTRPAKARRIKAPDLWPRNPPIRSRINIPTSWIELKISEGKNRQVRRMTAAVGFPTLRLVRISIGQWHIGSMEPGDYKVLNLGDAIL